MHRLCSPTMTHIKNRIGLLSPGLVISAIVAMAALFMSQHYGAPVMLFALLLGMALNFLSQDGPSRPGIEFTARHVLRWGVALLGLRITASDVVALGWMPLLEVMLAVVLTIGFGMLLARWMGFAHFFGLLTGGAVAICGASAALALSAAMPAHPLKEKATLFTVIGVSALSTVAMMLYPLVAHALGLSAHESGFFLGGTIHDVAQVVGAGYSISTDAGDTATLVKLVRVAMLLPVILFASWLSRRYLQRHPSDAQAGPLPPVLPGFAVAFAVLVGLHSTGWIPALVVEAGRTASQACLVAAMAAIGMKTHLRELMGVGYKPIVLMVLETLFLAGLVLGFL